MKPPVEIPDRPPRAVITQTGRWMYHIDIEHNMLTTIEGWTAFGRARAEKKARRVLRRYVVREARRKKSWEITHG